MDIIAESQACCQCATTLGHIKFKLNEKVKLIHSQVNAKLLELTELANAIQLANINLNELITNVFSDLKLEETDALEIMETNAANVYVKTEIEEHLDSEVAVPNHGILLTTPMELKLNPDSLIDTESSETLVKNDKWTLHITNAPNKLHTPYKYEKCFKTFTNKESLAVHNQAEHSDDAMESTNPDNKNSDISDKLTFVCDICPKILTSKTGLIIHRRTHTGENWFQCDICAKSFAQKNTLIVHMRTHTNERPFMCHQCCKTFNQPSTFKRHMLTHDGIKPFKCGLCERAFIEKSKLTVHMQSHTGERPHVCPICQRGYTKKYHVKKHVKNFHKVEDAESVLGPIKKRRSNMRCTPVIA